jgi:tRNA threonylcarbamoyladenosine biosynthesis protein TsaE
MPEVWETVLGGKPLSENELDAAAAELRRNCGEWKVWLFSGDLGAGKTTLIKAIGKTLGIEKEMSSPTFSIINEYRTQNGEKVYHFDFYRLKEEREAFDIGVEEYLDSGHFCLIEWPEKIPSLVPKEHVTINLVVSDPAHRIIQYTKHD